MNIESMGHGPGIVILHGGGVQASDYRRLARALSDRFTVHLYNRRGRFDSAPLDGTETVQTDLDDLAMVLEKTGARRVFGHSGGGFVALRAGLSLPLDRIAVYDPALSIDGRPDFSHLDAYEAAVRAGDLPRAFFVMQRATYPDAAASKLPYGVSTVLTKAFLRTSIGRRFGELLPTTPAEIRRIADHAGPASDYAGITAELLLTAGARSPRYFRQNCEAIAAVVPRGRALLIPRAPHNAANVARPYFVRPFVDFFTG
jgi:pimeloyl-ACP methyl ester carboxylesterase